MSDHPGRLAWIWTGEEIKGGTSSARPHGFLIPPEASAVLDRGSGKHVTSDGLD